jgi:UDP-N-acetylmuramate dehydrogenase
MDPATLRELASDCGVPLETGRRMSELTSLGVGGEIRALLRPRDRSSLMALLRELHGSGTPVRILGGGANIAGGPGPVVEPVVLTRTLRQELAFQGNRFVAGGGCNIKRAVTACVVQGLAGLEWAEGIPGTIGGALAMNAGSYGGEFSQTVTEIAWLAPDGSERRRHVGPGDFSYRSSPFRTEGLIVEGVFTLKEEEPRRIEARMKDYQARRTRSQPPGERSAGCIFKNPPGDSAGRVIDACGLKGYAVGGVSVSEVHANFVVNRGDATSEDLFTLIERVKEKVMTASGVALEEEVVRWP